jgi:hypothetical protein
MPSFRIVDVAAAKVIPNNSLREVTMIARNCYDGVQIPRYLNKSVPILGMILFLVNRSFHMNTDIVREASDFYRRVAQLSQPSSVVVGPIDIENIPVFYTLYLNPAADENEEKRVEALVAEQLASLKPIHHPVYLHSIGKKLLIPNTTLLAHHESAEESITLESLWSYCRNNTNSKVIYLHAKGSFHPMRANDLLRRFLTRGALSDECANLPSSCNVCSSRFSPFPHPHTPGNMWLARCDYVSKLHNPLEFHDRMVQMPKINAIVDDISTWAMVGIHRYANEHYIHSHPSVQPCDLYTSANYTYGYGVPENADEADFQLAMAPRFPLFKSYNPPWLVWDPNNQERTELFTNLAHRVEEYQGLYNETPDETFWGWRMEDWRSQSMDFLPRAGELGLLTV